MDSPETPENAVIDFVVSWQMGKEEAARRRVCEEKREEYETGGPFAVAAAQIDGFKGMTDSGWPTAVIDAETVLVYVSAGQAGPPVKPWFTPPERIFAVEMRKESGRWRVCDITATQDTVAGWDRRPVCWAGEVSDPEDPEGCSVAN